MSMSTRVPNEGAPASTVTAVSNTRRCTASSPGMPNECPNGNSTPTTRGAMTHCARSGIIVTTTVGIPARSMRRASTGTFLQQSGQAGASSTASTCSSRSLDTIWAAVVDRHSDRPACW